MALINCPECSRDISDKATSCPYCGYPLITSAAESSVKCLECGSNFSLASEVCPVCGLFNVQKYAGTETPSDGKPFLPDKVVTFEPPPRKKKRDLDRGILYGSAAVAFILLGVLLLGGNQEEASPKKSLAERHATLVARLDELIEKGDIVEAYELGSRSDLARAPGVKERIEQIAAQAKLKIAAQETLRRKKQEKDLLTKARALPASATTDNRDVYAELSKLAPTNKQYQEKFAHYDRLAKKAEQQRQERLQRFGAVPIRNGWDGSYFEIKQYLKQVTNDPESIEMDGCTEVYSTDNGWLVGCNYRGRNAFGGMIRQSNWFIIRNGQVVRMADASAYRP